MYFRSPPRFRDYGVKYSVPVLWDKHAGAIINNESEHMARMLNTAFDAHIADDDDDDAHRDLDFYPPELRARIDEFNAGLVPEINLGVYRAGFAADQAGYETHCRAVFAALDRVDGLLAEHGQEFVLGDRLTEVDSKAYATLVRFDAVYVQRFKLNIKTVRHDYRFLHRYPKNLYWNHRAFWDTTDFRHIKENYTKSHTDINPKGITPLGPLPDIEPWTEDDQQWLESLRSQ